MKFLKNQFMLLLFLLFFVISVGAIETKSVKNETADKNTTKLVAKDNKKEEEKKAKEEKKKRKKEEKERKKKQKEEEKKKKEKVKKIKKSKKKKKEPALKKKQKPVVKEKEKKPPIKGLRKEASYVLNPIIDLSKLYSADGTIVVETIETLAIRKKSGLKIAKRWAREIEGYFNYWLGYWEIKPSFIKTTVKEGEKKDEYIKLTFEKKEGYKEDQISKERIEKIMENLESKRGLVFDKDDKLDRYIKIDANQLFEYNSKNLRYGAAFILDGLVDIVRIYKENVGVRIEAYKQYGFKKGPAKKKAQKKGKNIGNYLVDNGIDAGRIFVIGNETEEDKKGVKITLYKGKIKEEDIKPIKRKIKVSSFNVVAVYEDFNSPLNSFSPSGWMGDVNDLRVEASYTGDVYEEPHSVKVTYLAMGIQGWAGICWQYPNNNWGNMPGSRDLRGAKKLTFWARGERSGERIAEFKVGGTRGAYSDSDVAWIGNIILSNKWRKYEINLSGKDLSHIITGFCFVVTKNDNKYGCTFYLDKIQFE